MYDEAVNNFDSFDSESDFFDYEVSEYDGTDLQADNFAGNGFLPWWERAKRSINSRLPVASLRQYRTDSIDDIETRANEKGISRDAEALNHVNLHKDKIAAWVKRNGQTPQKNPAALALQTSNIYLKKVADKQKQGVPDFDVAEDAVMRDEQEQGGEDADNFLGFLMGGIFAAGKALLKKINGKRTAKGKEPLFKGDGWRKVGEQIEAGKQPAMDKLNELERKFLDKTNEEIRKQGGDPNNTIGGSFASGTKNAYMKDALHKYLPWIIIAVVIVFIIGRKTS